MRNSKWITLSHDGFARQGLQRTLVTTTQDCDWCGKKRGGGGTQLFRYATQGDGYGARRREHRGLFCSKSCHDSYSS